MDAGFYGQMGQQYYLSLFSIIMELQNIFNSWASGQTAKKFTEKQWLLSKWENIEGIDWPQEKIAAMVDQITMRLGLLPDHFLLDLGCGGGWLLKKMQPIIKKGVGIDISFNMLQHAASFFQEGDWVTGQAAQIPFKEATFDRLLSYFVFINIQDKEYIKKSLQEIHRVLKKGGKALIGQLPDKDKSADYDQDKSEYLDYCQERFSLGQNYRDENYVPLQLYDRDEFCEMALQTGMTCRSDQSFNPFYRPGQDLTINWRFDVILEKNS